MDDAEDMNDDAIEYTTTDFNYCRGTDDSDTGDTLTSRSSTLNYTRDGFCAEQKINTSSISLLSAPRKRLKMKL
jgi:hypothetical protein